MATTPEIYAPGKNAPAAPPQRIARGRRHRRPSGEPPPLPRQLNASGRYWLLVSLAVCVAWAVVMQFKAARLRVDLLDHDVLELLAAARQQPLTSVARAVSALASSVPILLAWYAAAIVMLFFRRWRHLAVWIVAMWVVSNVTAVAAMGIARPRPVGIEILGPWSGYALPSLPVAVFAATLMNVLYALIPQGRPRQVGKAVAAACITVVAVARLYLAQDSPTDVLVAIAFGVTVPLVLFRLLLPNDIFPVTYRRGRTAHLDVTGRRGEAIRAALHDQLGVIPLEVKPFNLSGSGGSTPLRVKVKGDPDTYLFAKLYAANHLRADRFYKLGRTLLYGRLEDESAFHSVRQLVQYEDYALRLLYSAGLPVPEPMGIVEITPQREYLLVMEFFDGAMEIGDADVDESIIDQGMAMVRRLWDAGMAHRDIKPANLLVRNGQLLLIDTAFAEVRPSPWRQAVDLANMMLVLALRSDVKLVHARARIYFTDDEIAEAFAATRQGGFVGSRSLTMPSQLRQLVRAHGHDLHEDFSRILPYRLPAIAIQRWSMRRVALLIVAVVLLVFATQIVTGLLSSPL